MAAPSIWWSTPSRSDAHFSADQLRSSDAYHRPLRRAGLAGLFVKGLALVLGAVTGPALANRWGLTGPTEGNLGWLESIASGRVALGSALVVIALRGPATAVDGWFEFRFRRGIEQYRPVAPMGFVATTIGLAVGSWLLLTVVAGVGYRLAVETENWPWILGAAGLLVLVATAFGERVVRQLLPGAEAPLDPDSTLHRELRSLAAEVGLGEVPFLVAGDGSATESGGAQSAVEQPGVNACSIGLGPNRRVVLNPALLDADRQVRDFVVAHELTHLRRRHLAQQAVVGAVAWSVVVCLLALAVDIGQPWRWFGTDPADPAALAALVVVLLAGGGLIEPIEAWLCRAQERSADAGAVVAVGPLPKDLARDLYVTANSDLDPPRWVRIYAKHPSPSERLEQLRRYRHTRTHGRPMNQV